MRCDGVVSRYAMHHKGLVSTVQACTPSAEHGLAGPIVRPGKQANQAKCWPGNLRHRAFMVYKVYIGRTCIIVTPLTAQTRALALRPCCTSSLSAVWRLQAVCQPERQKQRSSGSSPNMELSRLSGLRESRRDLVSVQSDVICHHLVCLFS